MLEEDEVKGSAEQSTTAAKFCDSTQKVNRCDGIAVALPSSLHIITE